MTYHRVCNYIDTTAVTSGAGTVEPSGAPEFTPGFLWESCYSIFSFMCMYCRYLFVPLAIVLSVLFRFTDSDYPLVSATSSYSYGDFDASDGNGNGKTCYFVI